MKKLTLLFITLAIVAAAAIYFFFFRAPDIQPTEITDDASYVLPSDNPNYEEYKKDQERLRNELSQ